MKSSKRFQKKRIFVFSSHWREILKCSRARVMNCSSSDQWENPFRWYTRLWFWENISDLFLSMVFLVKQRKFLLLSNNIWQILSLIIVRIGKVCSTIFSSFILILISIRIEKEKKRKENLLSFCLDPILEVEVQNEQKMIHHHVAVEVQHDLDLEHHHQVHRQVQIVHHALEQNPHQNQDLVDKIQLIFKYFCFAFSFSSFLRLSLICNSNQDNE